jgi:hypothetical protein
MVCMSLGVYVYVELDSGQGELDSVETPVLIENRGATRMVARFRQLN